MPAHVVLRKGNMVVIKESKSVKQQTVRVPKEPGSIHTSKRKSRIQLPDKYVVAATHELKNKRGNLKRIIYMPIAIKATLEEAEKFLTPSELLQPKEEILDVQQDG